MDFSKHTSAAAKQIKTAIEQEAYEAKMTGAEPAFGGLEESAHQFAAFFAAMYPCQFDYGDFYAACGLEPVWEDADGDTERGPNAHITGYQVAKAEVVS